MGCHQEAPSLDGIWSSAGLADAGRRRGANLRGTTEVSYGKGGRRIVGGIELQVELLVTSVGRDDGGEKLVVLEVEDGGSGPGLWSGERWMFVAS